MPLIEVQNIGKTYGKDFRALHNVNCTIESGEFISIVGPSGAGKSTLLKLMYAEEQPTEGVIYFDGRDVRSIKKHLLPFYRRNYGTVFQDAKLLDYKTVFENVAYALEVQGKSDAQIKEEVPKILEIVGLEKHMDKYPHQLSGGEAQRTSIARALIHRPRVLVADEPTGNLDPVTAWNVIQLLLKVNEFGTTVLLATHDRSIVDRIQKRVIVVKDGTISADESQSNYML